MPYISLKMCANCCRFCSQAKGKDKKDEFKEEMRHYLSGADHANSDARFSAIGSDEEYYFVVQSILACADFCFACDGGKALIHDYLNEHIVKAYELGVGLVIKDIEKEGVEPKRRRKKGKGRKLISFNAERKRRNEEGRGN